MPDKRAKVVEIRCPDIIKNKAIDDRAAYAMFEAGFDQLGDTGVGDDILRELFPPDVKIGIKVNTLAGPLMSTSAQLVYVLAKVFNNAGHDKKDVLIWDRKERELKKCGYKLRTSGSDYHCYATDTTGVGFARNLYNHKSIGSMVSRIQTDMTDVVVNFPVLKDHSLAGLSGCLKNYYGAIHNPNKYHENLCNPYQADLYGLDVIGGKEKLALFDAIRVQYNGGPGYVSYWVENYNAILMSTDAIALDRVGIEIIDRLRTKNGMGRLKESGREPVGVKQAGKDGHGIAELDEIEWLVIEV